MTFRPTNILARKSAPNALDVLEHEVLQEKAATLARMTRSLEEALTDLAAFNAAESSADCKARGEDVIGTLRESGVGREAIPDRHRTASRGGAARRGAV